MRITEIGVRNFRSIQEADLYCDNLTVLVGPNGAGKSTFLQALRLFYDPAMSYGEDDFYARDTSAPISVSVTYSDLTDGEAERLARHVTNGVLRVEAEASWPAGRGARRYFGQTRQNRDFTVVRRATSVADKRQRYSELVSQEYPGLPQLPGNAAGDAIESAVTAWEEQHPERLEFLRDDGQFFGFKEVGVYKLERDTRFIFVPAVLDAAEAAVDRKGSLVHELMHLLVQRALSQREDLKHLERTANEAYTRIVDEAVDRDLADVAAELADGLTLFAPACGLKVQWRPDSITLPVPAADVTLVEDAFESRVDKVGHGLQRAFILALLKQMALSPAEPRESGETEEGPAEPAPLPGLILAIEEPELYQHPSRQRHIREVLVRLAEQGLPGVASNVQVMCTTHSPLFVDLRWFNQVRLVRKRAPEKGPSHTTVSQARLEDVARTWWEALGQPGTQPTDEIARAHIHNLMTPWSNEGFFAQVVALVEGPSDRAAIVATAELLGHSLDGQGIAVIPCGAKTCLLKAAAIFRALELPVYLVWDSDESKEKATAQRDLNRHLLRYVGSDVEAFYPDLVEEGFACFGDCLETTLEGELGKDVFDGLWRKCADSHGCHGRSEIKRAPVMEHFVRSAAEAHGPSPKLSRIVEAIMEMQARCDAVQDESRGG